MKLVWLRNDLRLTDHPALRHACAEEGEVAALFATTLLTLIPAMQFSGLIDPVTALQGPGRLIASIRAAHGLVA